MKLVVKKSKNTIFAIEKQKKVNQKREKMGKHGFWYKAFHLYYDGFRSMTLGKTLWLIIGIKLVIMFLILKIFFFPNHIKENAEKGHEAEYVAEKMLEQK